jgi:hypothetical protein
MREFIERDIFEGDAVPDPMNLALTAVPIAMKANFEICRRLNKMILRSGSDFFTSDHPVVWFDPENCSPSGGLCPNQLSLSAEVTLPLTRRHCLVMAYLPFSDSIVDADQECVDVINARTALNALRETYAPPVVGQADKLRHAQTLIDFRVAGKSLFERYGDDNPAKAADVWGIATALGLDCEAVLHANKFIDDMAENAEFPTPASTL